MGYELWVMSCELWVIRYERDEKTKIKREHYNERKVFLVYLELLIIESHMSFIKHKNE